MANAAPAATVGAVDAALMDVVRTAIEARYKLRWSRAAELFERAAERFAASGAPADSLVTAGLRVRAALALSDQAQHLQEDAPEDAARLLSEAWAITAAASRVLSARADANTLLPGTIRADELAFARAIDLIYMSVEDPEHAGDADYVQGREADDALYGYEALMRAAQFTLCHLLSDNVRPLPAVEARAFVLRALALVRDVEHTFHELLGSELFFVHLIDQVCAPENVAMYRGIGADAAFYDQLVLTRNLPATRAALVAHGTLAQNDLDELVARERDEAEARRAADAQARGLRPCALPSCAAKEVSVRQFKVCGACKEVAYCCADHAKAHWKSGHKQACNAQNNA